jgi:hypothetical protein
MRLEILIENKWKVPIPGTAVTAKALRQGDQRDAKKLRTLQSQHQWLPSTTGISVAGGVLRLRPQRTKPSIMTMPMPGMSPS